MKKLALLALLTFFIPQLTVAAITASQLDTYMHSYYSGTVSSQVTADVSPTSNKLQLLMVFNDQSSGAAVEPTVSGCGLTWVKINTVNDITEYRVTLFRALGTVVGAPCHLTIDFGAGAEWAVGYTWTEFTGMDTTGTNGSGAIVQDNTFKSTSTSTPTVDLGAFSSIDNATFGAVAIEVGSPAIAQGSGFTELGEAYHTIYGVESEFRNDNDTSVDWTVNSASQVQATAVEIKVPATLTTHLLRGMGRTRNNTGR